MDYVVYLSMKSVGRQLKSKYRTQRHWSEKYEWLRGYSAITTNTEAVTQHIQRQIDMQKLKEEKSIFINNMDTILEKLEESVAKFKKEVAKILTELIPQNSIAPLSQDQQAAVAELVASTTEAIVSDLLILSESGEYNDLVVNNVILNRLAEYAKKLRELGIETSRYQSKRVTFSDRLRTYSIMDKIKRLAINILLGTTALTGALKAQTTQHKYPRDVKQAVNQLIHETNKSIDSTAFRYVGMSESAIREAISKIRRAYTDVLPDYFITVRDNTDDPAVQKLNKSFCHLFAYYKIGTILSSWSFMQTLSELAEENKLTNLDYPLLQYAIKKQYKLYSEELLKALAHKDITVTPIDNNGQIAVNFADPAHKKIFFTIYFTPIEYHTDKSTKVTGTQGDFDTKSKNPWYQVGNAYKPLVKQEENVFDYKKVGGYLSFQEVPGGERFTGRGTHGILAIYEVSLTKGSIAL